MQCLWLVEVYILFPFEYISKAFEEILSNFPGVIQTFIIALILVIIVYCIIIKKNVLKWIISHRKASKQALLFIAFLIVICLIFSICYHYYYFPEPSEDQLVVAISPFYSIDNFGKSGFNIPIADDIKEKIESSKDCGINVKRLEPPPIENNEDAKFQGKKEKAHIIIYGVTEIKSGGIQEIKCYIIPLPSLKVTSTELKFFKIRNFEKKDVEYSTVTDEPIVIIESLKENISSIVYTISALEKYKKSNYTSAINLFKSIENYKKDSSILFFIGNCYCSNNNINESIYYFNKATEIDPQNANAWYNKGFALHYLGKYEEAIAAYDNAIEIDPQYTDALYIKGFAFEMIWAGMKKPLQPMIKPSQPMIKPPR